MSEALSTLLTFALIGGALVLASVLMLWLARKSERGTLKPNEIAGVRTKLALSSETAWYSAQRAAAPRTKVAGWGGVIGGSAVMALGLLEPWLDTMTVVYVVLIFGTTAWLFGWVIAGSVSAQRAARDSLERPAN